MQSTLPPPTPPHRLHFFPLYFLPLHSFSLLLCVTAGFFIVYTFREEHGAPLKQHLLASTAMSTAS